MKLFSKISLSLLCAIGVLGFCACGGNNEVRETLQRAESLMEDRPDSSLQIIKDIDTLLLKSPKDIALYSLLRTQAEDKNYKDTTDTRIITRAVDYYAGSKDEYHKMLSYYYRARIEQNARDYSRAIVDLMSAEKIGLEIVDYYYLGLIYRAFSDIYNNIYCMVESIKYARKSYDCFLNSGKEDYVNLAMIDLCRAYHNGRKKEDCVQLANTIIEKSEATGNKLLLSWGLRFLGVSNLADGQFESSIDAYTRLFEECPKELKLSDYRNIGKAYLGVNQIDKANFYRKYVEKNDKGDKWLAYEIYAKHGDYENAYLALEQEYKRQDEIIREVRMQNVTDAVLAYNEFEHKRQDEQLINERRGKIIYLSVFVVIVLLLLVVFYQHVKANKRELQSKMLLVYDLQSSLNDTRLQNTNLQTVVNDSKEQNENLRLAINELYGQTLKTIDDLCGEYYSKEHDKRIVKKIDNLVEKLKDDEKTIAQLEDFVNKYKNNVVLRFRQEYPDMRDVDYKLFIYLSASLSVRAISVLLGIESEAMSSRKKRLKRKISESESQFREEFIKAIG